MSLERVLVFGVALVLWFVWLRATRRQSQLVRSLGAAVIMGAFVAYTWLWAN